MPFRVTGTEGRYNAMIKVEGGASFPYVKLADVPPRIGDWVLAVGNPFGVGQTVTMGIVSALGRSHLGINTFENFIQTDATINPGNSGGALVDTRGSLVGINTAIYSRSGGSMGIGFAVTSKHFTYPPSLAVIPIRDIHYPTHFVLGWNKGQTAPVVEQMINIVKTLAKDD